MTDLGIWLHNTNCFNGSESDLVNLANNSKKNDGLSDTVAQIDKIYKAAELFVGENYNSYVRRGYTWYESQDGTKRVRVGTKASKNDALEANFETFNTPFDFENRENYVKNYHVSVIKN